MKKDKNFKITLVKNYLLILATIFYTQILTSQTNLVPEKKVQNGFLKVDFLSIEMPQLEIPNEPNMGFSGIHYNLFLNDDLYAGLGIYGAVTGRRGGFFTLGVNAGYKKFLTEKLFIDTGFHFGGGGGAAAADGGGAFILPHFNLGYKFDHFNLNAGYSYVNFFDDGKINGSQLNFAVEIPVNFNYSDYNVIDEKFSIQDLENSSWNNPTKKSSLTIHFNNLKAFKAKNYAGGVIEGKTIRLAGFEFANYITENWFAFLKLDGAYSGIRAGYMDVLLGAGYNFSFNKYRTNILTKLAIGAGGGGGVNSDGGFMISPDISIEHKIFSNTYLALNKGYLFTPNTEFFTTSTYGFGLKYYVDRNGIQSSYKNFKEGKFKGIQLIVKQDWYLDAERMELDTEDMHQISLQVNFDLSKNLYVAGQTSFANFGNAGAYAEGIVGLGLKSGNFFNKSTTIFTQILAGAAGGGNISTGEGLIIKPSLGLNYQLTNKVSLRSAFGYVKAKGGELSNPFLNFGLNFDFSFLNMK